MFSTTGVSTEEASARTRLFRFKVERHADTLVHVCSDTLVLPDAAQRRVVVGSPGRESTGYGHT